MFTQSLEMCVLMLTICDNYGKLKASLQPAYDGPLQIQIHLMSAQVMVKIFLQVEYRPLLQVMFSSPMWYNLYTLTYIHVPLHMLNYANYA